MNFIKLVLKKEIKLNNSNSNNLILYVNNRHKLEANSQVLMMHLTFMIIIKKYQIGYDIVHEQKSELIKCIIIKYLCLRLVVQIVSPHPWPSERLIGVEGDLRQFCVNKGFHYVRR